MSKVLAFPGAKPEPREINLVSFAGRIAHEAALKLPATNACGIRVGDLFYATFGYDMTINHFYEVVEVKAKATVILRRIAAEKVAGSLAGDERPIRGHYTGAPVEKRSRMAYGMISIPAPELTNRHLYRTTDDALHYFNTLD
jgi:hypothetical protein